MAANDPNDVEGFFNHVAKRTWEIFIKDPVLYIVTVLVAGVLGGLSLGLLAGPLFVGCIDIVAKRMRGENAEIGAIFSRMGTFLTCLIVFIILGAGVTIGLVLLVIPGLVLMLFVMFTFHAIALDGAGIGDSISKSFNMVKANLTNAALLFLALAVLNGIGGSVVFGSLLTGPLSMIALTVAYERFKGGASAVPAKA